MDRYDAVLVGAGIMSSTLASLLHALDPGMRLLLVERLEEPALESSAGAVSYTHLTLPTSHLV